MPRNLLAPGHTACAGCGQALAARLVVNAAGPDIIVTNATGCLEVFTSLSPMSSWEVPWIHSLFENSAAIASGVEVALKALGKGGKVRVLAFGGDGGTADIGLQALSGMIERGHDVLYVCYDNEAYMNTGVQRSGLTPMFARTTTSPAGKVWWGNFRPKKDMPAIAAATGAFYVATASVAYPRDLMKKVKKALTFEGPKYIQIHVPCPLGWAHEPSLTPRVAKLAVETGLYPIFEMEQGKITRVRKVKNPKPVTEYLKLQKRFRHLFKPGGEKEIEILQEIANENLRRFGISDSFAQMKEEKEEKVKKFTLEELEKFDGRNGKPAYIAYKGKVYDVTESPLWEQGEHEGVHFAGADLTGGMEDAPHLEDVLERFPIVGELEGENE